MRMAEIYAERFADPDGRVRATFEIVWLSGWAPHPSQQQPLKPGSAQARLADALGTQEVSTGVKGGALSCVLARDSATVRPSRSRRLTVQRSANLFQRGRRRWSRSP